MSRIRLLAVLLLVACQNERPLTTEPSGLTDPTALSPVNTIVIVSAGAPTAVLVPKDSLRIPLNATLAGSRPTWRSTNSSVASVTSGGLVIAKVAGSTTITATSGTKRQATVVTVAPGPASLVVNPTTLSMVQGTSVQLTASVQAANGTVLTHRTVTYTPSNSAVAAVDSAGKVVASAVGATSVVVRHGTLQRVVPVTVTPLVVLPPPPPPSTGLTNECQTPNAAWIFCDDFEQDRKAKYFEVDAASGRFARVNSVGNEGSYAMRGQFLKGSTNAGSLKLAFGRTPGGYFRPADAGTANYREVYWRFYVRNSAGWQGGGGNKLTRATSFVSSGWAQSMLAHVWSGGAGDEVLVLDPASGTDAAGNLKSTKYNDFANLRWMGIGAGSTGIFRGAALGPWHCVEAHVRLNDAGQSNGVFEFWVDDVLNARQPALNWVGSYSAYGINAVLLENYWNAGSPVAQDRFFDNFIVSTQRIGC